MSERVQPGGRVDRRTYEDFKQFVRDRHGTTRGVLGEELENAMRKHMSNERGDDQLTRIESDVASVKAMLAASEADGGELVPVTSHEPSGPCPTPSDSQNTHARLDSQATHTAHEPSEPVVPEADRADPTETDADESDEQADEDAEQNENVPALDREALDLDIPADRPAPNSATERKVAYLAGVVLDSFDTGYVGVSDLRKNIRAEYEFGDRTVEKYVERLVNRLDMKRHPENYGLLVYGAAIEQVQEQARAEAHERTDELDASEASLEHEE